MSHGVTHHKRDTEFVRHDIVQNRVNRRGHVIENSRYVGHEKIKELDPLAVRRNVVLRVRSVNGDQPLNVKWRPADEERYYNSDCNRKSTIDLSASISSVYLKKQKQSKKKDWTGG